MARVHDQEVPEPLQADHGIRKEGRWKDYSVN